MGGCESIDNRGQTLAVFPTLPPRDFQREECPCSTAAESKLSSRGKGDEIDIKGEAFPIGRLGLGDPCLFQVARLKPRDTAGGNHESGHRLETEGDPAQETKRKNARKEGTRRTMTGGEGRITQEC